MIYITMFCKLLASDKRRRQPLNNKAAELSQKERQLSFFYPQYSGGHINAQVQGRAVRLHLALSMHNPPAA